MVLQPTKEEREERGDAPVATTLVRVSEPPLGGKPHSHALSCSERLASEVRPLGTLPEKLFVATASEVRPAASVGSEPLRELTDTSKALRCDKAASSAGSVPEIELDATLRLVRATN